MTMSFEEWDQLQARWSTRNDHLQKLWHAEELDDEAITRADLAVWSIEKELLAMPAPHASAVLWKAERIVQDELEWATPIKTLFLEDTRRLLAA